MINKEKTNFIFKMDICERHGLEADADGYCDICYQEICEDIEESKAKEEAISLGEFNHG